jgi:hypothetical protein
MPLSWIKFLISSGSTSTLASSLSASDDGFVGVHDGELYTEPSSHSSMSTLPPASLYGGRGEDPAIGKII